MPESDYQIAYQASGASAAAVIGTDELSTPAELNAVTVSSTAATSNAVAPDVQKNGTSIYLTAIGTVFQGQTAQSSSGGLTTSSLSFDFVPAGKPIESNSYIQIDSEIMLVTGVAGSPTQSPTGVGVQRVTVTRAQQGTSAATHASAASVFNVKAQIPNAGTTSLPATGQLAVPAVFAAGDVLTVVGVTGATNLGVVLDLIDV